MARPNNDDIDVYELLNRADELLNEEEEADFLDDADVFDPDFEEPMDMDATIVYRNAANNYGYAVRNAANNYGAGPAPAQQTQPAAPAKPTQAEKAVSSIRAYNADFMGERSKPAQKSPKKTAYTVPQTPPPAPAAAPPVKQKKTKKRGCLSRLIAPVAIIAAIVLLFNLFIFPPKSDEPLGSRKSGVSSILLCGTDVGGERTDTMMLLYVDSVNRQAGLLSLPRDTYTVSIYGESNKLNSAYWRNGRGEEGMDVLLDYVQRLVGYRPDGYMLIELPMLRDLVDLMGGVEFDVPQAMDSPSLSGGIHLDAGLQKLTGDQALGLLRFRYGYENQDLGRQDVQKDFLKACMEQWVKPANFGKFFDALDLMEAQSFTDLKTGNFLWFGWNLLKCGFSNIYTDTLPGYATMIGDQSYYVLYPEEVAAMVQDRYNPYKIEITTDLLDIDTE